MSFGGGAAGRLLARTPPRPRPPVAMPHALPAEAPVDALRWSRRSPHLSSPTRSLDSPVDSLRGRRGACSFVHALWERPGGGGTRKKNSESKDADLKIRLKSLCGGGVPSSHPSLGLSVFFLSHPLPSEKNSSIRTQSRQAGLVRAAQNSAEKERKRSLERSLKEIANVEKGSPLS